MLVGVNTGGGDTGGNTGGGDTGGNTGAVMLVVTHNNHFGLPQY